MNDHEALTSLMEANINEMNETIYYLYMTCNIRTKNILLNRLRKNMSNLSRLAQGLQNSASTSIDSPRSDDAISLASDIARVFTADELSRYNGKDGNPAYVAVNGTVYDVTNNAAWAAATHFGLTAGKDVTGEFASCHAGQPILSRLKVVGKIAG